MYACMYIPTCTCTCTVFLLQTRERFQEEYKVALESFTSSDLYGGRDEPHHYATFAYDAIWTMALALDRADAKLKTSVSLLILSCVCIYTCTYCTYWGLMSCSFCVCMCVLVCLCWVWGGWFSFSFSWLVCYTHVLHVHVGLVCTPCTYMYMYMYVYMCVY